MGFHLRLALGIALAALAAPLSVASAQGDGELCCSVVSIAGQRVTASERATGRTFVFEVADQRLLATLRVGRAVHASFTTMQVSVQPDGLKPCCGIVSVAGAAGAASPSVDPGAPCCFVVANASLRRLGRVVVAYPIAATGTRLDVFRAGQTQSIAGGYGNQALDLLPGTYDVEISGKRVAGVTVQSGQETQIKVGVLRVQAGGNTRVDVVELGGGKNLVGSYGDAVFGLPIGRFDVRISGQTATVTVAAGQTTEF